MPCHVPRVLQHSGQQWSRWIKPVGHVATSVLIYPCKMSIDVVPSRKVPCHNRRTARRTDATSHRKPKKISPFARKTINIRCLYVRMAMATEITPSPIISKDKNDVGLLSGTHHLATKATEQCHTKKKYPQGIAHHDTVFLFYTEAVESVSTYSTSIIDWIVLVPLPVANSIF